MVWLPGRVHDGGVGDVGEDGLRGLDAHDVRGIVEGAEVLHRAEAVEDLGGDEDGLRELVAAVEDAVADGSDYLHVLDDADLGGR